MDKHIFKKNTALTKEESNNCIKYFESHKNIKEDKSRGYSLIFGSLRSNEFNFLKNILITNIDEYVKQHSFLGTLHCPWTMEEYFNIQKYYPGNYYGGEHMEHGQYDHNSKKLLAWMFYLNDIKEGGGTGFDRLDEYEKEVVIKPQMGRMVVFNNVNDDGSLNLKSRHAGLPVIKGEKWAFNLWLRERE